MESSTLPDRAALAPSLRLPIDETIETAPRRHLITRVRAVDQATWGGEESGENLVHAARTARCAGALSPRREQRRLRRHSEATPNGTALSEKAPPACSG